MTAQARSETGAGPAKRSLASIVRAHGALPITDAVDIALDICEELAHAHMNGVVHGDLGLQRVRTDWPRKAWSRVDIFGLRDEGEAFGAIPILTPPEQREGRALDRRADIWALGALVAWMLTGGPRRAEPQKVPGPIQTLIDRCLAEAPENRPGSVDEVAEVLGSFASSPPYRFEQVARRRAMAENAMRVRQDLGDVDRVLGRLDDLAFQREMSTAARLERESLIFAIQRGIGSAVFQKAERIASFDDDDGVFETEIAVDPYDLEDGEDIEVSVEHTQSLAPVEITAKLLPSFPETDSAPQAPVGQVTPVFIDESSPRKSSRTRALFTLVGVLVAIVIGLGIGAFGVDRIVARKDTLPWVRKDALPWTKSAPAVAPPAPAVLEAPPASAAPPPSALPPPSATGEPRSVPVMSPSALPDARAAREVRPAPAPPPARPKPAPTSESFELSPSALTDALH